MLRPDPMTDPADIGTGRFLPGGQPVLRMSRTTADKAGCALDKIRELLVRLIHC